ncbi:metalloprotease family protein [Staphylococcus auricularis]|uniref:metalloprotease family protein n=1 Tax=Staphylococcus auricularis TaxID=29379 RepID=UPI003EBD898A
MFLGEMFSNYKQQRRFILAQIVITLVAVLIGYRIAYAFTHIIEQGLVMNLMLGGIGFISLCLLHFLLLYLFYRVTAPHKTIRLQLRFGMIRALLPENLFHKGLYILITIVPLLIILILWSVIFSYFPYSSLILIMSSFIGYCALDLCLVLSSMSPKVKYVEEIPGGLRFYSSARNLMHKL